MTITYTVGDSLYVNTTNRCSNSCEFCVRSHGEELYGDLWLDREPTKEEILADIEARTLSDYKELVFCGYGEPTERLDDILWVCRKVKENNDVKIRINTNGHSDLINGRDTTPEFKDCFDTVSISLNCADAKSYQAVCRFLATCHLHLYRHQGEELLQQAEPTEGEDSCFGCSRQGVVCLQNVAFFVLWKGMRNSEFFLVLIIR